MFLVIGHSDIAVQLAKWCSERRPTRLIGLASMLQIEDEIGSQSHGWVQLPKLPHVAKVPAAEAPKILTAEAVEVVNL